MDPTWIRSAMNPRSGLWSPCGARVGLQSRFPEAGLRLRAADLVEDRRIANLAIAGQQEDLREDLGGFGVVIDERQEEPAAMLAMDRNDEERPTGAEMHDTAAQVDGVLGEVTGD